MDNEDSKSYHLRQAQRDLDAEIARQAWCRIFLETCGVISLLVLVALAGALVFS